MATNDPVLDEMKLLRENVCKRLDEAEEKIEGHERRIVTIETSLPILLNGIGDKISAMDKTVQEFKADWFAWIQQWGNWMKYAFIIIIVLILVVAALAGVQKLPEVPVTLP